PPRRGGNKEVGHRGRAVAAGVLERRQPPGLFDRPQQREVGGGDWRLIGWLSKRRDHQPGGLAPDRVGTTAREGGALVEEDEQRAVLPPGRRRQDRRHHRL